MQEVRSVYGKAKRRVQRDGASGAGCELAVLARQWAALVQFQLASRQLRRGFFHRYTALAESLIRRQRRPLGPPFALFARSDAAGSEVVQVEAGFWVNGPMDGLGDVLSKELPETLVATSMHEGPHERIGETYTALLRWMDERRLCHDGARMEVYLNGPDGAAPRKSRTRLIVPVQASAQA